MLVHDLSARIDLSPSIGGVDHVMLEIDVSSVSWITVTIEKRLAPSAGMEASIHLAP